MYSRKVGEEVCGFGSQANSMAAAEVWTPLAPLLKTPRDLFPLSAIGA
jgi:hypothetical protein